ncbi:MULTISPECIES: hypothetical protein [Xanthomonas]|uniref:hypothetical protein n=1 Tax=Xanthomonas TaxID=338 RepID=UPI0011C41E9D|nr:MULTISPECIES: hypothetical protein [Xanthomonas]CAD1790221.1 hypothetical protein XSP_001548 [Xanthomonas sp. CPBF 426]CAG2087899.1 hypothetical protein XCY_001512 [Xanthomonas euroxanthea]
MTRSTSLGSTATAAVLASVAFFLIPARNENGNLLVAALISLAFVVIAGYVGDSIYNSWNAPARPKWQRALFLITIMLADLFIAWLLSPVVLNLVK